MTAPNREQIRKMWGIFASGKDSVLELRAIWPSKSDQPSPGGPIIKHFRGIDYPTVDALRSAFEVSALQLNARGFNIYTVMNPINSSFKGKAARDADIAIRDLLLIDIDRMDDTSRPATDEEIEAAHDLANRVKDFLAPAGWPEPVMVMSGNGVHLYYFVDCENTEANTKVFERFLKLLAQQFNNDFVGIDTTVYNASRITKVPGTIARKGVESEGRPYRMATVYE